MIYLRQAGQFIVVFWLACIYWVRHSPELYE